MILEDFFGTFNERMEKLEGLLAGKENLILIGSSYGGLMSAVFACLNQERVRKLILLAPALHLEPFKNCLSRKLHIPVLIYHGMQDEVVPMADVRAIAPSVFRNLTFNVVDDDHSLHKTFASLDWDTLLEKR